MLDENDQDSSRGRKKTQVVSGNKKKKVKNMVGLYDKGKH